MNLQQYIKKFPFPANFQPPTVLSFDDLTAKPLTRSDLKTDMEAVNSSLKLIRDTRGGSWPSEPVTEEFDFLDLAWHEREFRDNGSFAYVVYDSDNKYIGCFYLYPIGHRTELNEDTNAYDIDASWWVTTNAYEHGYYEKLYTAMQEWLKGYPSSNIYYSNNKIPS
jgi:hypothetical protein